VRAFPGWLNKSRNERELTARCCQAKHNVNGYRLMYRKTDPLLGGVTPTAGGLVFAADLGGQIYAMDAETGKILCQTDAG